MWQVFQILKGISKCVYAIVFRVRGPLNSNRLGMENLLLPGFQLERL